MGMEIPKGNGKHPITLVAVSANQLAASTAFYSKLFGWQTQAVSKEVTAAIAKAGPAIVLRADTPAGFPGVVPFIAVPDVDQALQQVIDAGGRVERATWTVPMAGKLARFRDPSGTIYGLNTTPPFPVPVVPLPFGANPKPPAGSICSVEMYGAEGEKTRAFFQQQFGWGARETMPQFVGFDPGAGISGVFQSHTPALSAVAYLWVDDVGATLSAVVGAGGAKTSEAMPMPGMGTFGYFTDPSGTPMGLIGP
jgi:predicted enzyme related to lactoylglutathione lyase